MCWKDKAAQRESVPKKRYPLCANRCSHRSENAKLGLGKSSYSLYVVMYNVNNPLPSQHMEGLAPCRAENSRTDHWHISNEPEWARSRSSAPLCRPNCNVKCFLLLKPHAKYCVLAQLTWILHSYLSATLKANKLMHASTHNHPLFCYNNFWIGFGSKFYFDEKEFNSLDWNNLLERVPDLWAPRNSGVFQAPANAALEQRAQTCSGLM